MPTHVLYALLTRIGLALVAGVLIAMVPIALRKARFEARMGKRVAFYLLAVLALIGFGLFGWYLVNQHVPKTETAPEPVVYPTLPTPP
ncbi:MAG: hypothetical protein PHI93_05275 [Kiritimatiellae bacterium]|jgi:uncharacterized membrane protein|nr:hypothetical protein [Kiritimatiellia bacterium]MDY0149734.1 hypothetical protein [Kiritimatiellia bacterium]